MADPNVVCPLCLSVQNEFLKNIDLGEKIEKYLQIKMNNKPIKICISCYKSLEEFHEFYIKVHSAQKNLQEVQECNIKINKEAKTEGENLNILNSPENSSKVYIESKTSGKKSKLKEISNEVELKMLEFYNTKCEKCDYGKFTSFKMLNKHYMTVHNTQGYIKCCKRNIRVNDKYYLRSHMFKHLQPESCRCRVCGKELSSLATLKHHMQLHKPTEERPFQCNKCDKGFCCKNDLRNHEKVIHLPENKKVDYICDVCGKVFQKVANLRYHHSTVHLQERKFICEVCAKCFTTQTGLRTHINSAHSTLDPIQCHECNKWLKTKETYQKHLQLHQNNTYPCSHCDKVCNSSASLRSHLVKHSEERPYSCLVCKKSFKTKTHLKNHSTQHLGGSHYKCPYCPKIFVNMSNFYTHRRRMHSKERTNLQENKVRSTPEPIQDYKIVKNDIVLYPEIRQNIIISPVKY